MQSFRAYKLATLRLTCLMISERAKANELSILEIQNRLKFKSRLWFFLCAFFISASATGLTYFYTNQLTPSLICFITLLSISTAMTFLPNIINRLISSQRYSHSQQQVHELEKDTQSALIAALNYQKHLEIESGPGFIAIYEDIILSDSFETDLDIALRKDIVKASLEGRGASINLSDYKSLLFSLQQQLSSGNVTLTSLVDSIPAQSDHKATIAFASLIANQHQDLGLQALRIAAIIGLHTSLSFKFQSYDNAANQSWIIMEKIFRSCLECNSEAVIQYVQVYTKLNAKKSILKNAVVK